MAATILGSAMVFIDGTIVGVALPAVQRTLGATVAEAQWVVAAYTLFLSALMLVGGALGDVLGRRRVFAMGTALFAASSVWCGLAPDVGHLVAARAVQGVAGALLTPGSLALIAAVYPEEERGRAIGTWSGWSGVATAAGPVLGGWLVDHLSWRWAFFVNLPVAIAVLALVAAGVPESRGAGRRLDVAGALLVTLGLGGLAYGMIEASARAFSDPTVVAALALGAAGLGGFAAVERRAHDPMVPFALFRSRPFAVANGLTLLLYGALAVALFFLPFDLIQVQGYSATAAGAALLPFVGLVFLLSRPAGKLADRAVPRLPLVLGPSIAALGFALLAWPGADAGAGAGAYARSFLAPIAVLGVGMGITIAPLTTAVMNAVGPDRAGTASGINNAVARGAGLVAIAGLGVVVVAVFQRRLDALLAPLELPRAARAAVDAQRMRLAAIEVPRSVDAASRAQIEVAIRGAFVAGFRVAAGLSALLALASAGIALLLPRRFADRSSGRGH